MTYQLFLLPRAQKELARLPTESYERVLYEIEDTPKTVTVVQVGHRRDIYR